MEKDPDEASDWDFAQTHKEGNVGDAEEAVSQTPPIAETSNPSFQESMVIATSGADSVTDVTLNMFKHFTGLTRDHQLESGSGWVMAIVK
jgi:hypothetical protein